MSLDVSQGAVVGVLGDWGSGKTSFVNLARTELGTLGAIVLDFNPWMFSGAEQLVNSFFVELVAQLKLRPELTDLADGLEDYGEAFASLGSLPLVGPWIEGVSGGAKLLALLLKRRKSGVGGRRLKVVNALGALSQPVVVVLDDIDRLSTPEIREIFKLVRLTASFPNVVYIVSFARKRVEDALADTGISGRAYLEKILQVTIDLPALPPPLLDGQLLAAVDDGLRQISATGPFHTDSWPDIYAEVVRPLIHNLRDVRRYSLAISQTVSALDGQIALADVLALEAVRVFLPDVHSLLHRSVDALTETSDRVSPGSDAKSPHKAAIDQIVATAGEKTEVIKALISRLFPAATRYIGGSHYGRDWSGRWRRDRRVAHGDVLRLYLERTAGTDLKAFFEAEKAWALMTDEQAFEHFLKGLPPDSLNDTIAAIEDFEEQFTPDHAVPGTTVLLNILQLIPQKPRGMFEFGPGITVSRITLRLLRALPSPEAVAEAVGRILPRLRSLSAQLDLIRQVGHRPHAGHKLATEAAATALEVAWRTRVRAAPTSALLAEPDLLTILWIAGEEAVEPEQRPVVDADPTLTLALLRNAVSETLSQSMESRAVRRSPRLNWEGLSAVVGGEAELLSRIAQLRPANPPNADDILALAERYASGWRPSRGE